MKTRWAQEKTKMIFVTIGHEKNSYVPMGNKMRVLVFEDETEIQVAKRLRKKFADNACNHGYIINRSFNPAKLYWAIYDNFTDENPRLKSDNFPSDYAFDKSTKATDEFEIVSQMVINSNEYEDSENGN